jgi:TPR repeat protein
VASVQVGTAPGSGPQSLSAQRGSPASHLDAEEIATLINRGTDSLKSGDLASARLLLRRAAEAGSASAALMLGTTFDPLVIQQLGAIGVVSDVAQARQWYEKAVELGSDAASQRLAKLPQTGQ